MERGPLREATLSGSPAEKRINRPQPQAGSISPLPHRPGPHSQVGDSQRGHRRPSSPPRYEAPIRRPHPTPALAPRRRSAPRHPFSASIQPWQPRSAGFQKAPCTPTPSPLGPPPSTAPTDGPPTPPGLDLSPKAQRSQALATQATNPPKMHLRPQRPAACHGHGRGHPRGRPSAARPSAPRGGRDSAAWASHVPSCVGHAGLDRCARGLRRPWPGLPRAPARARPRPGAPGADLEPKLQRRLAQWPPRRAPRPRPAGPAPSARAPAGRWRPSERAVAERRRGAAGRLVRQSAGAPAPTASLLSHSCRFLPAPGPLAAWLGRPQGLCTTGFCCPKVSSPTC